MPNVVLLIPIADILDVTVTELLRGEKIDTQKNIDKKEIEELVVGSLDMAVRDSIPVSYTHLDVYKRQIYAGAPPEKAYAWTIAEVKSILKEETYIGHSVHNKQSNISFKNKKKVRKPQEEWYRVENTHEAIISEEVFQKVQELIASRRRKRRNGTTQIFAGLIKCADCGWS